MGFVTNLIIYVKVTLLRKILLLQLLGGLLLITANRGTFRAHDFDNSLHLLLCLSRPANYSYAIVLKHSSTMLSDNRPMSTENLFQVFA